MTTDLAEQPCGRCGALVAPAALSCAQCGEPTPLRRAPAPGDETEDEGDLALDLARPITSPEAATRPKGLPARDGPITNSERPSEGDAKFKAGDVILGHYTVVKQLGRGGMGTVYLARDEVSGQEVAVKVLPAALARERDIRERFVQEARALASMDHPNIVPLVTFAQDGEDRFLVMKYVPGEALDARIRRLGVLPPEHARRVLRAMLSALGYAHARGVIHRDVKPSNVLIEGDLEGEHRVFLVDFGIAKKDEDDKKRLTQTGMLMGTPQYMSPEQIGGHKVDGRSDLYAAGLVLFEMLSGRPPFDGQKTFQVLRAHVEQPVPDVRDARALVTGDRWLPDDVVAITYLLLRKDPEDRPADATEAIALLDGTGSFPPLRPEEMARLSAMDGVGGGLGALAPGTPPAVTPPTTSVPAPALSGALAHARNADDVPTLSRPERPAAAGGFDDEALDDPSVDEIRALQPRRGPRLLAGAALLAITAGAFFAFKYEWPESVLDPAPSLDAGAAEVQNAVDDAAFSMLLAKARLHLENNELESARLAVDAALDREPDNIRATSLRVDVLIGGGALDDAERTLARLRELITAHPETDEGIKARADEQEKLIAEKRDANEREERERKQRQKERERAAAKKKPSELSKADFNEVTAATRNGIRACYVEHVQARYPKAAGVVRLTVRVGTDGAVDNVSIKSRPPKAFRNKDFTRCLETQVKKWKFRPFGGQSPDVFAHEFNFVPI